MAKLERIGKNVLLGKDSKATKHGGRFHREAYVCVPRRVDPEVTTILEFARHVMPIMYGVSLVFLILAFINVYIKSRDRLFGMMTLCLLAMLAGFYVCILTPHIAGAAHINESPILCQIEGFCIQFFYISAMFWLNSMCLDIWRTFRTIKNRAQALKSFSLDMKTPKGISERIFNRTMFNFNHRGIRKPQILLRITLQGVVGSTHASNIMLFGPGVDLQS